MAIGVRATKWLRWCLVPYDGYSHPYDCHAPQLVANFTATRLDPSAEPETGLRAFEWLVTRWILTDHATAEAAVEQVFSANRHQLPAGCVGSSVRPVSFCVIAAFNWRECCLLCPNHFFLGRLASSMLCAAPLALQIAREEAESSPAARQALYDAQLAREVGAIVEEVLPTLETNSAQEDDEVGTACVRVGKPRN